MSSAVRLTSYETRYACLEALEIIRRRFRLLENAVPRARWVPWENAYNWRFTEQRADQLLLQKLARQISGIQTIDLLLMAGHLQEIGVLYRMLDEIAEDITFLALGMRTGNWTSDHEAYAKYFWSEDDNDKQSPVQRKKVRAYVNRAAGQSNPSHGEAIGRLIHKTFSDYVHVRSAPIMGMVKGPPAHFDLDGIHTDEPRIPYVDQNPTYYYRCLISVSFVANVVLSETDRMSVFNELKCFETKHHDLLF